MPELNEKLSKKIDALSAPFRSRIGIKAEGSDGFSFSLNASVPMAAASLIKLPILLYVCDRAFSDPSILNRTVWLGDREIVGGSGVLQVLSSRAWPIRDLLALMINVSDNTATNLLIDTFGIGRIQKWIGDRGYAETLLGRKLMDQAAKSAGLENLISARDACRSIRRIFSGKSPYPAEVKRWFLCQQFRYKLPGLFDEMPNPVSVYNKTGEMEKIDHDAAFFSYRRHDVSIAVLTRDFADRQKALAVIQNIGKSISDYLIARAAFDH
ncbi:MULTISPECIES: serine hydrolase [unclassified Sporolactobacillus]|uniref:serine hydrolase n=1 Tax=unclassified Sporolactobacillus TaxID=2628533 RepID=UPI002367CF7F|nr:serine hydrolase [Sporolactobacillus sp. CQH2019]MDD9148799.1 class A beta-lactamase-related serine hydrolase [Sporolactobacillus sp. CQH2019]